MIEAGEADAGGEKRGSIRFTGVHRVTHEEGRVREARFWAAKSMAERVIAGWELAANDLIRREGDEPKSGTGIVLRRVVRSGR